MENEADTEQLERGVMAAGIAKAGELLIRKYTLLITNVPFLARSKQDVIISTFCLNQYPDAKNDLATVFLDRMLKHKICNNTVCIVSPHNWLFQPAYRKFREKTLVSFTWNFVVRLGENAFESTAAAGAFAALSIISTGLPKKEHSFATIDVSANRGELAIPASQKAILIKTNKVLLSNQNLQLKNPDGRISFGEIVQQKLMNNYGASIQGLATSDDQQFTIMFWEIISITNGWEPLRGTVLDTVNFGGCQRLLHWEEGKGRYYNHAMALKEIGKLGGWKSGTEARNKQGIIISQMATIPVSIYLGEFYDHNACVIIPLEKSNLLPIWAYCSSEKFNEEVRKIDQSLKPSNNTFVKVPFDLEYWKKVSAEKYPNGLPKPYSDDPTQWLFHGHPIKTENPLQVALVRILGYRWPAESDKEMELAEEAKVLIQDVKAFDHLSDEDGIFCIPSVNAEQAGAERLRDYLQQVFTGEWNNQTISHLLQKEGAKSTNLETWLRDEFFVQHCKVFQNRPFIWHIWDGRKDGFSALVNYHKLDKDNLSKLIYTYLNDWIRVCVAKKNAGESGAEGLLSAAQKLKENLEAILHGEAPYDIFVRWKSLEQQPIGWDPDLNDGVRLNIRPFVEAGVLRNKFNVKWGIDRGKNPPNSFWGEVRDNDKHLGLEEKLKSRENKNK